MNLEFKHKATVCKNCGAVLRDHKFELAYMHWLEIIYKEKREKFQIQCFFSPYLVKCVDEFLKNYPGISYTVFMRILTTVYLNHIDVNSILGKKFNELIDQDIINSFMNKKNDKKINIQFKPKMMIDIISIAELIEEKPSQIVESCILKMMAAIVSTDEKLKVFWEKEVKSYLEIVLKAA